MRQRLSIVALVVALLASACVKDGDFDELNHPMRIQGEFDPTYGFPVAWADADLGTLMGFVPSGAKFKVLADPESGLLTLEKDSILHNCYTFETKTILRQAQDGTKDGKRVVFRREIVHGNKIGLEELKKHDMVIKRLDLQMSAFVKAELSGSADALLASGAEVYFDTLHMTIDFEDGTTFNTDLYWDSYISAQELVEGKHITMPDPYDASYWVNSEAKRVHFSTAINVAAIVDPAHASPSYVKDSLHIDSLIVDCHAIVDFPAILYVGNLHQTDTIAADMSQLDSILNNPSVGNDSLSISINDSADNYLYIQADNGLPANLTVQLRGLDSNYTDLTGHLLPEGQFFTASGVTIVPDDISTGLYEGYMSNGRRTHSDIRIKVNTDIVRNLAKSKYIELSLLATTPTELPPVGDEAKPFVVFRDIDKVKLKVSLRVSPHINVNYPVNK